MKHLLFSLLFIIAAMSARAQDTLYFNSENKVLTKKKNPEYYKIITKTDSGYVVELLDKQKSLYNRTTYKDPELKTMDGFSTGYRGKFKSSEGKYLNGKPDGTWKYYHWDGNVSGVVLYQNGTKKSEEYFKSNGEKETDAKKIEQLPSFPGGQQGLGEYLGRTLRYPPGAREKGIRGRVTVGFTVDTNGELLDVRIVKSVHEELDREALRVVRGMPRWIPGVQFNRPVKVAYTMPVFFHLSGQ